MMWLNSAGTGILTAILGAVAMGMLADRWTDWFRVSHHHGGASLFVAFYVMAGFAGGFLVGFLCSQKVITGTDANFGRGVLLALQWMAGLIGIVGVASYFLADHEPKLEGRELELAVEIRTPPATPLLETTGLTPSVSIQNNPRSVSSSLLVPGDAARKTNGAYTLSFAIPLRSSSSTRIMNVEWFGNLALFYALPLRSKPTRADFEWTDWLKPEQVIRHDQWKAPDVDTTFLLRYRVAFHEEPARP